MNSVEEVLYRFLGMVKPDLNNNTDHIGFPGSNQILFPAFSDVIHKLQLTDNNVYLLAYLTDLAANFASIIFPIVAILSNDPEKIHRPIAYRICYQGIASVFGALMNQIGGTSGNRTRE